MIENEEYWKPIWKSTFFEPFEENIFDPNELKFKIFTELNKTLEILRPVANPIIKIEEKVKLFNITR